MKFFTDLLFACLWLLILSCESRRRDRLNHATAITDSELRRALPFVVGVTVNENNVEALICTGTLVAPDKVLTAAHCFCQYYTSITVSFLSVHLSNGMKVTATNVVTNPSYDCSGSSVNSGDIALITLSKKINLMQPVRLYCQPLHHGTRMLVAGFGMNEMGRSGVLSVGYQRTSECPKDAGLSLYICANVTSQQTNLNHGDSGGPALVNVGGKPYQVGVSKGFAKLENEFGQALPGILQIYTKIDAYCNWLNGKL